MDTFYNLTNNFVEQSRKILSNNLVGIYLHGSAAMGCFNPDKSDLDLIIVVKNRISDEIKKEYMRMVVKANANAPFKGIEMSLVRENVCKPFVYPTPFELHFSNGCIDWYKRDIEDYIAKMKGYDKDLAAHFTIIKQRGKVLFGKNIDDVFGVIERKYYFDSIWCDIENAVDDISKNTMYIVLNLTRVLAYAKDGLILSKKEGGEWGKKICLKAV